MTSSENGCIIQIPSGGEIGISCSTLRSRRCDSWSAVRQHWCARCALPKNNRRHNRLTDRSSLPEQRWLPNPGCVTCAWSSNPDPEIIANCPCVADRVATCRQHPFGIEAAFAPAQNLEAIRHDQLPLLAYSPLWQTDKRI